jgi:hypothetical protein
MWMIPVLRLIPMARMPPILLSTTFPYWASTTEQMRMLPLKWLNLFRHQTVRQEMRKAKIIKIWDLSHKTQRITQMDHQMGIMMLQLIDWLKMIGAISNFMSG